MEKILVLDFGGQYNQLIARRVRDHPVYAEILPYTTDLETIKKNDYKGISQEENTWRYIGGIFGQYFWKEFEGDHWGNIWAVFLKRN